MQPFVVRIEFVRPVARGHAAIVDPRIVETTVNADTAEEAHATVMGLVAHFTNEEPKAATVWPAKEL